MGLRLMILGAVLGFATAGWSAPTVKVVTALDRFEPFVAHAFHAGHLWVGKSRDGLGAKYSLEVYDSAGVLVKSIALAHSIRHLQPYGPQAVILSGIAASPNLSHFTIVQVKNGKIQSRTTRIPMQAFADEVAGSATATTKLVFTDPGGDSSDTAPIGTPAKTFFIMSGGSPRYLSARLRGPHNPRLIGNDLFVIEHPSVFSGGKYLVRLDLTSGKTERLMEGIDISDVKITEMGRGLLISDRGAKTVTRFNVAQRNVDRVYPIVDGEPKAAEPFGKCLAVALEMEKKIIFVNEVDGAVVATWDLAEVGEKLYGLRALSADFQNKTVHVRSAYPADPTSPGGPERNSVVMVSDASLTACQ